MSFPGLLQDHCFPAHPFPTSCHPRNTWHPLGTEPTAHAHHLPDIGVISISLPIFNSCFSSHLLKETPCLQEFILTGHESRILTKHLKFAILSFWIFFSFNSWKPYRRFTLLGFNITHECFISTLLFFFNFQELF